MLRRLTPVAVLAAMLVLAAGGASAAGFDLVGFLDPSPSNNYVDIWGWSHPTNGRSYALIGNSATGLYIVDVSTPSNPFQTALAPIPCFDIKTYRNWVYTVDGLVGGSAAILDVANPSSPVVVGDFPGGHNIWIDTKGFLYVALPGLTCYDLNDDPTEPALAWEIESVDGHDAYVDGDILYDFRGYAGTFIYDVTDRYAPMLLGHITDPNVIYHHEGRLTEDGRYLYLCDEFAMSPNPDITIWDLQNVANPVKVGAIYDPTATVHNVYVVGQTLAAAYYTSGFKLFDITNPSQPALMGAYDTSSSTGEGNFNGAFGCYPYGPGGTVYVSDRPNGLFVFELDFATGVEGTPAAPIALFSNSPNPFGTATRVAFRLDASGDATLAVYDAAGRRVRALRAGFFGAGEHAVEWDGKDDAGRDAVSGVYFCRLQSRGREAVRKMVLVR